MATGAKIGRGFYGAGKRQVRITDNLGWMAKGPLTLPKVREAKPRTIQVQRVSRNNSPGKFRSINLIASSAVLIRTPREGRRTAFAGGQRRSTPRRQRARQYMT